MILLTKKNYQLENTEVLARKESVQLFTVYPHMMSNIVMVDIFNPKLSGSAYKFYKDIPVGITSELGFCTGVYLYYDNEKYVQVELLLPGDVFSMFNHPDSAIDKQLKRYIMSNFLKKKRFANCSLLYTVPTTCYIKESDLMFVQSDGTVKYISEGSDSDEIVQPKMAGYSVLNDGRIGARAKCTFVYLYDANLQPTGLRIISRGTHKYVGMPTGRRVISNGREYIEVSGVDGYPGKYFWVKKVAVIWNEDLQEAVKLVKEERLGVLSAALSLLLLLSGGE